MIAAQIAELLNARPAGRDRWKACCPAHPDKHPSLSITQGRQAVLLRCWSHGCTPDQVCAALGLRISDLFDGPAPTPEQARAAAVEREKAQEAARQRRATHGRVCDHVLRLERVVEALGSKLALVPDDAPNGEALAELFHAALDKLRAAEAREMELRP
jgi:hypothetical protein